MTLDQNNVANCACFNLRKATRALTSLYDNELKEVGITTPQFTILAALEEADESKITPLAERLVMDRTTLTRNLDRLSDGGLVTSRRGTEDRRTRVVTLTDEGRDILDSALPEWERAQDEIVETLGEDTFEDLLGILRQIPEVIDK